jgi:hypothetical protein
MEFTTSRKECSICKKEFSNIARHQRKCKPILGNRFIGRGVSERKLKTQKCLKCSLEFANINRHKKLCKGPKIIVSCHECGKKLINFNLKDHVKLCHRNLDDCDLDVDDCDLDVDDRELYKDDSELNQTEDAKTLEIKLDLATAEIFNFLKEVRESKKEFEYFEEETEYIKVEQCYIDEEELPDMEGPQHICL